MERPRLIASDVDGTLLGPDERVSPRTAAAVRRALAADVPLVLVTGRPPRWVRGVAREAGTTGLAVCANGAVLYDIAADRVVWTRTLDPVRLADLAHTVDHLLPGAAVAAERVSDSDGGVAPFVAEPAYRHAWDSSDHSARERAEVLGRPAVKLLVRHAGMTSAEMVRVLAPLIGDDVCVTYSTDAGLVELSARDVTKASGLADAAERIGVDAADVVAFGDMPNDLPMLAWAGHGVAMANGHPEVLRVADEVTASHAEDGVAQVLERWF